jgi:transcriptional regulator with XRE-family HTH domain
MRKGIEERGPIAAWLITSRAQFREPGAKRTWTVEQFLAKLEAEVGWAPTRTTYARWESGSARPDPENMRRVQEFYAARGISPYDEPVVSPAASDTQAGLASLSEAVMALVEELRVDRQERTGLRETVLDNRQQIADLNQAVAELTLRLQRAEGHGATRENGAPVEIG